MFLCALCYNQLSSWKSKTEIKPSSLWLFFFQVWSFCLEVGRCTFSHKNPKENVGKFFFKFFLHSLENFFLEIMTLLLNLCFVKENCFYSYIHISTLLFSYTQMKMINLSPPPENMNSIQEACGIVGMLVVTAFVGNHWATDWLCLCDLSWPPDFRDQMTV